MIGGVYSPGERVVTRRGKIGTVVSATEAEVMVRFGGRTFPMRPGQLVAAGAYQSMQRGAAVLASNQRYNMRRS